LSLQKTRTNSKQFESPLSPQPRRRAYWQTAKPGQQVTLEIEKNGPASTKATAGRQKQSVPVKLRIDTPIEIDYYRHGGILPFVLRQLLTK
jgi:aconitase A